MEWLIGPKQRLPEVERGINWTEGTPPNGLMSLDPGSPSERTSPVREPLLYTIDEVCFETRLSRAKVAQLVTSGVLPSIRIGRSRRVEASVLRAWLADLAAAERDARA